MEVFLHEPEFDFFLHYFNGSPMDQTPTGALWKSDLPRAKMGILLTDKNAADAVSVDHKNILIGLMMKKYVYEKRKKANLPLAMQLIKPESKQHYFSSLNVPASDD